MSENKRFFWIKINENFYKKNEKILSLFLQKNFEKNIVIFQMLCIASANTGGRLEQTENGVARPCTEKEIRDLFCNYYSLQTVKKSLFALVSVGLMYQDRGGTYCISDFGEFVGSDSAWAEQKRRQRAKTDEKKVDTKVDISVDNVLYREIESKNNRELRYINNQSISLSETRVRARDTEGETEEKPAAKPIQGALCIPFRSKLQTLEEREQEEMQRTYCHGGAVFLSDAQFDDLCERLSLDELNYYLGVVADCEEKGMHYGKTHYDAILDMAEQDRRVRK